MRVAPSGLQWLLDVFHGKAPPSRGALWRASFDMRDRERIARQQKNTVTEPRNRFGEKESQGWCLLFVCPYLVS
jgi:hypothetical protein